MPLFRRRPLMRAAMVGGAGFEIGEGRAAGQAMPPSTAQPLDEPIDDAASESNRIDALTKLKGLLDTGVLTQEQYDSEHARLTEGI
jgi:hypothetical protein